MPGWRCSNPASSACVVWSVRIYGSAKRRTWCLSSVTENFDEGDVASIIYTDYEVGGFAVHLSRK